MKAPALRAHVIGSPVSHSLSPAIFAYLGFSEYSTLEVRREEVLSTLESFRQDPLLIGANITVPHKEAVLSALGKIDEIDDQARKIGAVNVIRVSEGRLQGFNTDHIGIARALAQVVKVGGSRVLVLGAGGAARAALYSLGSQGASYVKIFNRDLDRAHLLAQQMGMHFPDVKFEWRPGERDVGLGYDLCVNATSLGLEGSQSSAVFEAMLRGISFKYAFDMQYRTGLAPGLTPFLKAVSALDGTAGMSDGLEMLVEQALATWKIWFGKAPETSAGLLEYLRERPVFLTGFMGVGKSTVAPLLAKEISARTDRPWSHVDLDQEIERIAGKSVSKIFEQSGEPEFRKLEREVLAKWAFVPRTVVALGGGALQNSESAHLLQRLGRMVYLAANPQTLAARLLGDYRTRPHFALATQQDDPKKDPLRYLGQIEQLFAIREAGFLQAHLSVNTDGMKPNEVVDRLIGQMLSAF